jgi:hypothetical protein
MKQSERKYPEKLEIFEESPHETVKLSLLKFVHPISS